MQEIWNGFVDWFFGLGAKYGVNPIIFGSIYVGAIPLFTLSVGWLIANFRKGKSITLPSLSAGFWFISAYLYLFIAGENIPLWVYAMIIGIIGFGAYSSIRKIQKTAKENKDDS